MTLWHRATRLASLRSLEWSTHHARPFQWRNRQQIDVTSFSHPHHVQGVSLGLFFTKAILSSRKRPILMGASMGA